MPLEHGECDYRASELRGMLRQWNALGGDEMRATVADAARTLEAAHERIAHLETTLRQILRVDWERGTDWGTGALVRSYLDAALRMQDLACAALSGNAPGTGE